MLHIPIFKFLKIFLQLQKTYAFTIFKVIQYFLYTIEKLLLQ